MRVISLLPLTKRAKQIVKQHGERWEVVKRQPHVLFDCRPGPWLYIQPLTEERAGRQRPGRPARIGRAPADNARAARLESAARWVHEFNDDNFKVAP